MPTDEAFSLLIAALGGAAVGLEREWSGHAAGPKARFAGIRTFTLLGLTGGLGGWFVTHGLTVPAATLLLGAVGLIVAAYVAASRQEVDATTEVAALVVVAAGTIAGVGHFRVTSAVIAVTSLLLVEKSRLHALAAHVDDTGLRAAARFAVMALVVLPLLPEGPFGPFGGLRPRELWALVLFFSGLSFAGFLARRLVGPAQGYIVTGLLGGLISSTNVTLMFARASRREPEHARALGLGAIAGNAVLYPRMALAVAVLASSVTRAVLPYLVAPWLIAVGVSTWGYRSLGRTRATDASMPTGLDNPLQLRSALQMAVVFQVVLMIVAAVRDTWGSPGVLVSAAVLGLTDVDALTLSMARGVATLSATTAALGIGVGVLTNTVLKTGLALTLGSGGFRWVAGGTLACMVAAASASLFFLG
ncbi:MAG: MgtC/SapB family protein [Vicinamibacterales bacterium]